MGYQAYGAYQPFNFFQENTNVQPYVEPDKASRTTAIFQGISGVINSASDFYQRIKYNPKQAYGAPGDPNVYWGGGVSWIPGQSGEPNKLQVSGLAGFTPLVLIGGVILLLVFLAKK